MGTTLTAVYVGERGGRDRARRRQPRLLPARRRAAAADRRPLARRRADAPGPADARGGRGAPAALGHHARARARGSRRGRHALVLARAPATSTCCAATASRRWSPRSVLARVLLAAPRAARGRRGADRRRQRGRRPRQHHRACCCASRSSTRARAGDRAGRGGARAGRGATSAGADAEPPADQRRAQRARAGDTPADAALRPPSPLRPPVARRRRPASLARPRDRPAAATRAPASRGARSRCLARDPRGASSARARYLALQSVYFIGTNNRGLVTVFQGVPYRLPGNLKLYSSHYVSGVSASTLTPQRRSTLLDHSLRSEADAASLCAASNSGSSNEAREMNRPIVRLYGLVIVLFALLIAFTSRWTIFEASSLRDNPLNARSLLEQQRIDRGRDPRRQRRCARAQRALAGSRRRTAYSNAATRPANCSRTRSATTITDLGQSGPGALPQRDAERPVGHRTCSRSSTSCRARSGRATRSCTTLDPAAQRVATRRSPDTQGAVVALEPAHRRGHA